jgi:hypothetical protein
MKKTILALTSLIEHRRNLIRGFQDKSQPWNIGNEPLCIQIIDMFSEFLSKEVQYLERVVLYTKNDLPTKCKHPKKYHDKCDGIWYCMKCNQDIK